MTTAMQPDPLFHRRGLSWFVIAAAVFLLRTFPWFNAELWYDEVLTLVRFVFNNRDGSLISVFRDYPIANNHILSTAIYWLWTHLVGFPDEAILRLPSIVEGLATIAIVMRHWRKFIGDCLATVGGLMLAISPVFTAYAYQVRGYSLTFLLAAVAVSGVFEILLGSRARGRLLLAAPSLLLPLVMPTNAILTPALVAVVAVCHMKTRRGLKAVAADCLPAIAATALGAGYYLTIWKQFKHVIAEPDGWSSATGVAANVLLAAIAHSAFLPVLPIFRRKPQKPSDDGDTAGDGDTADDGNIHLRFALSTTAACALLVILSLACSRSGHAPFPRVFLVFCLPMTAAVLAFARARGVHRAFSFAALAVVILCNGILWERLATSVTDYQLSHGRVPDNLLQQYYRGSTELRAMAAASFDGKDSLFVVTDAYDIMSFRFYWQLQQRPPETAAGVNELPQDFWGPVSRTGLKLAAFTKTPDQAADIFSKAGLGEKDGLLPRLKAVASPSPHSLRKLYMLQE